MSPDRPRKREPGLQVGPPFCMSIYFYSSTDEYGCFSNFSPHGVDLESRYWPTVEHYFQAMKFDAADDQARIARARTPKEAKSLGWNRNSPIRPDWDEHRDHVMLRAVRKKFQTHENIRKVLLSTGEKELVENAPGDYYWGCGADGSGENRLGKILMQVRAELNAELRH